MTTQTIEKTNVSSKLEFLQEVSPSAYENVLHLLSTTYHMKLFTLAEQEFLNRKEEHFRCFDIDDAGEKVFRQRYELYTKAKPYVFYCKNSDYCVIYCVDNLGTIRFRVNLYNQNDMKELFWRFGLNLHECAPMWHVKGGSAA